MNISTCSSTGGPGSICPRPQIEPGPLVVQEVDHSRTQSPSYARSTERDEGLWPNPYQTGI